MLIIKIIFKNKKYFKIKNILKNKYHPTPPNISQQ